MRVPPKVPKGEAVAPMAKQQATVFLHNGKPAIRLDDRLYRWTQQLNQWQQQSTWANGEVISDYFEMKWRGEIGIVANDGIGLPPEKWELVRE